MVAHLLFSLQRSPEFRIVEFGARLTFRQATVRFLKAKKPIYIVVALNADKYLNGSMVYKSVVAYVRHLRLLDERLDLEIGFHIRPLPL